MSQRYEGPIVDGPWVGKRYACIWNAFRIDVTHLTNQKILTLTYWWDEKGRCWHLSPYSAGRWESVRHEFEGNGE